MVKWELAAGAAGGGGGQGGARAHVISHVTARHVTASHVAMGHVTVRHVTGRWPEAVFRYFSAPVHQCTSTLVHSYTTVYTSTLGRS